jgi:rhodanese-related sulfurtransferase
MKKCKSLLIGLVVALFCSHASSASAQFGIFGGPRVETIDTSSLVKLMNDRQAFVKQHQENGQEIPPQDYLLIDVRSEKEIAVSIIPGAITKAEFERDSANYQNRTIIPYCTVGGRSGTYAKQLLQNGWKVKNYQGSILDWVNSDLPLVTPQGERTNQVHTFNGRYRVPDAYQAVVN